MSGQYVVMARVCVCDHLASDHEPDCSYGWEDRGLLEPDEYPPCDCTLFRHYSDLVAAGVVPDDPD